MAGATVNVSIRMDAKIKEEAEALFSELGLSLGAAVNVFVRQAVRQGGLPFPVTLGDARKEQAAKGRRKQEEDQAEIQSRPSAEEDYASLEEFFAKLDAG